MPTHVASAITSATARAKRASLVYVLVHLATPYVRVYVSCWTPTLHTVVLVAMHVAPSSFVRWGHVETNAHQKRRLSAVGLVLILAAIPITAEVVTKPVLLVKSASMESAIVLQDRENAVHSDSLGVVPKTRFASTPTQTPHTAVDVRVAAHPTVWLVNAVQMDNASRVAVLPVPCVLGLVSTLLSIANTVVVVAIAAQVASNAPVVCVCVHRVRWIARDVVAISRRTANTAVAVGNNAPMAKSVKKASVSRRAEVRPVSTALVAVTIPKTVSTIVESVGAGAMAVRSAMMVHVVVGRVVHCAMASVSTPRSIVFIVVLAITHAKKEIFANKASVSARVVEAAKSAWVAVLISTRTSAIAVYVGEPVLLDSDVSKANASVPPVSCFAMVCASIRRPIRCTVVPVGRSVVRPRHASMETVSPTVVSIPSLRFVVVYVSTPKRLSCTAVVAIAVVSLVRRVRAVFARVRRDFSNVLTRLDRVSTSKLMPNTAEHVARPVSLVLFAAMALVWMCAKVRKCYVAISVCHLRRIRLIVGHVAMLASLALCVRQPTIPKASASAPAG